MDLVFYEGYILDPKMVGALPIPIHAKNIV
jgi:hypothetical protein